MDFTIGSRSCFVHCAFQVQNIQWTKQGLEVAGKVMLKSFTLPHSPLCEFGVWVGSSFVSQLPGSYLYGEVPLRLSWALQKYGFLGRMLLLVDHTVEFLSLVLMASVV